MRRPGGPGCRSSPHSTHAGHLLHLGAAGARCLRGPGRSCRHLDVVVGAGRGGGGEGAHGPGSPETAPRVRLWPEGRHGWPRARAGPQGGLGDAPSAPCQQRPRLQPPSRSGMEGTSRALTVPGSRIPPLLCCPCLPVCPVWDQPQCTCPRGHLASRPPASLQLPAAFGQGCGVCLYVCGRVHAVCACVSPPLSPVPASSEGSSSTLQELPGRGPVGHSATCWDAGHGPAQTWPEGGGQPLALPPGPGTSWEPPKEGLFLLQLKDGN